MMINTIHNSPSVPPTKPGDPPSAQPAAVLPPATSTALPEDALALNPPARAKNQPATVHLFETDPPAKNTHPWKVTSVHVNAGYIVQNDIPWTGPMRIQNANYGTDLTITGIQQEQRTSFEYLQIKPGQRFAPDEPQFNLGVNVGFANKFGAELDLKHNKITGGDYNQIVHFEGMMNGQAVNHDAPLNTYMRQHEQTFGNMQISLLGTRSFDLPAPESHRFSFITKAGPSLITSNTRTALLKPDGQFEQTTSPLGVAGYGFELENALRYELGPKAGGMGLEVGHAFSYLNFAKYPTVGGGTGSHQALASQFSVKLTKTIGIKK